MSHLARNISFIWFYLILFVEFFTSLVQIFHRYCILLWCLSPFVFFQRHVHSLLIFFNNTHTLFYYNNTHSHTQKHTHTHYLQEFWIHQTVSQHKTFSLITSPFFIFIHSLYFQFLTSVVSQRNVKYVRIFSIHSTPLFFFSWTFLKFSGHLPNERRWV